ncbi:uncharacterized protein LOC107404625 [Ziziphus jujuba]|uniref:Uncharacterized protein LOC107404625 n=1 Tax=Ziziphus jujuba TaxID=326968 RepID=A0A6P3YTU1_ZIZJJ|nr:uncharacterized protein LOC107404625 [Ziziphus jujuba]
MEGRNGGTISSSTSTSGIAVTNLRRPSQRIRIENPFALKVGQVFTGFGIGCGVGIGVGRPINIGSIPVVNQVMSATRGATDAFSGVSRHVNSSLKKLGAKNIEAGIGCGVGFGHGFGVGLALKPGVLNQIQFHVVQAMTKMMMKVGIVPNLPIDQGAISSSLQGGMNIINASSTQNPMGSIMQLATKQTDDTSQGMLGHGNKTTGSVHETFMSKNTSADSTFGSRTEKVINSFLQNPVLKREENETNEVAGRLRSENNLLHMVMKHQQVIEELKEENEKLRQILVEELKIPPSKLQASYSSKNSYPCTDCFDCRRKQRKK